jgi:leader peptidase (prepilin peptidase)/N-methyltransferase
MDMIIIVITGWLGGMLVNYLSDMLPSTRRLSSPVCVHCYEKQPLVNYFLWPKRCFECQLPRPWRVWLVEITYIAISIWLWQSSPGNLGYIPGFLLFIYFGIVVVIDAEHRLILHPVSITGGVLSLGIGWKLHGLPDTLIGGAFGFIIMLALYYLGDVFARWLARRRGEVLNEVALGFGDVNLSGVIGLLLGWPGIVFGLILAILLGGLISLIYIIVLFVTRRYRTFVAIPYGPFLVISGVILIYFKDFILR